MSLILDFLLQPNMPRAALPWTTPGWWGSLGESVSGVSVGPETALKISTVYACVGLISETIASLPLVIYRYIENQDGRERARNHPLYEVLHDQANEAQTAFQFVQMMQAHALLRGSGYALIQPGARGFADQLIPLHPDQVEKEKIGPNRYRYQVTDETGRHPVNAEDVLEVGGLTLDGWNTVSVIRYARDSFGLTISAEQYGGRFFRNDSRPGGVLRKEGTLSEKAAKKLKASWEAAHTQGGAHRVAVLEEGLEWQQIGISPEEAQFLGTREFQAEDVCRWFRVPPHMVGLTSKATSWGSGIEEMTIGFLTYTLRPWLTRWRQTIRRDLILATGSYFADFVVDELLRGDIEGRYNAYSIGRQWGWLSVNDVRRFENMNPIGAGGDRYLTPMNMEPVGEGRGLEIGDLGLRIEDLGLRIGEGHYVALAREAAGRVVRKEIAAVGKAWERAQRREAAFDDEVRSFYEGHANLVAVTMQIPLERAVNYCEAGCRDVLALGVAGLVLDARVEDLLSLTLEVNHG